MTALVVGLAGVSFIAAGCSSASSHTASRSTANTTGTTTVTGQTGPLQAPQATPQQDGDYLTDVTEVDPTLANYAQSGGEVAARALLTDGSAFCAFLARDRAVDPALVSLAVGARSVESQTKLPLGVTTFNTIEAVALLTLCPAEQALLPASDRSHIAQLGRSLGQSPS